VSPIADWLICCLTSGAFDMHSLTRIVSDHDASLISAQPPTQRGVPLAETVSRYFFTVVGARRSHTNHWCFVTSRVIQREYYYFLHIYSSMVQTKFIRIFQLNMPLTANYEELCQLCQGELFPLTKLDTFRRSAVSGTVAPCVAVLRSAEGGAGVGA